MAKGSNQKLKIAYLTRIMLEKTDDEHGLTLPQIVDELARYDVTAERKSIYADFADMTDKLGIEIIKEKKGKETYYHAGKRDFEVAEIKLLIDAIQASKFITEKKSNELMRMFPGRVFTINIHEALTPETYPNFKTEDGRIIYYALTGSGIPNGLVNRCTERGKGTGQWQSYVYQETNSEAPCNIAGLAVVDEATRSLTLTVEIYYTKDVDVSTYLEKKSAERNSFGG